MTTNCYNLLKSDIIVGKNRRLHVVEFVVVRAEFSL